MTVLYTLNAWLIRCARGATAAALQTKRRDEALTSTRRAAARAPPSSCSSSPARCCTVRAGRAALRSAVEQTRDPHASGKPRRLTQRAARHRRQRAAARAGPLRRRAAHGRPRGRHSAMVRAFHSSAWAPARAPPDRSRCAQRRPLGGLAYIAHSGAPKGAPPRGAGWQRLRSQHCTGSPEAPPQASFFTHPRAHAPAFGARRGLGHRGGGAAHARPAGGGVGHLVRHRARLAKLRLDMVRFGNRLHRMQAVRSCVLLCVFFAFCTAGCAALR